MSDLHLIRAASEYVSELSAQDEHLIIEMTQAMLNDAIDGGLKPVREYVRRYCNVFSQDDECEEAAAAIEAAAAGRD